MANVLIINVLGFAGENKYRFYGKKVVNLPYVTDPNRAEEIRRSDDS